MSFLINNLASNPLDESEWEIKQIALRDFPHLDLDHVNVNGKNGPIEFYNVDSQNIKVLAFDESTHKLIWTNPSSYSIHPHREIEIVNLEYGLQIITDDDPRAVYGLEKEQFLKHKGMRYIDKLEFKRFTPTEALKNNVLVPVSKNTYLKANSPILDKAKEINLCRFLNENYIDTIEDALRIKHEAFLEGLNLNIFVDPETKKWSLRVYEYSNDEKREAFRFDLNDNIDLLEVKSVEYTRKFEDGYDLTVPGYETFVNESGLVLSNTINVHVPGLPEAVEDAKNKLRASKQIFSIRDLSDIPNKIKQEFLLGSYMANKIPAKNRYRFATKEQALQAIRAGKIKMSDEVEIG